MTTATKNMRGDWMCETEINVHEHFKDLIEHNPQETIILRIITMKNYSKMLVTNASIQKKQQHDGYCSYSFAPFSEFNVCLEHNVCRVTRAAVESQHTNYENAVKIADIMEAVILFYKGKA